MIIRRRPAAALLGMLAALSIFGVPPAHADETTPKEPPNVELVDETTPKEPPKVELVLDISGSMRARDIEGHSRISVLQQAFNEVLDALPSEAQVGIRVLGATYPGKDQAVGCRDTQQLVPIGPIDKLEAKTAVATLRPTGFTPVGLALRAAARDLGTGETTRRIVLITDGEDTCAPPDPCEVARELAAQGTHLVVDTLGLTLNDKVRRQLTCIASATGGTYTAVTSKTQLRNRINQLVDRAATTYTQTPAQVDGTENCSRAPLLSPGAYTDREKFQEHRWYRVLVRDGQELRASVSVSLDRALNRDYGVLLRAVSQDGRELVRGTDAGSGRTDVLSTGLRWSAEQNAPDQTVCLVVSNSFSSPTAATAATPGMPLELTVGVVDSSPAPNGPDLGRGWGLLGLLALAGLVGGLVFGWLARWRVAIWMEN
ncbi:VWA domain-containing protein [Microtetraspora malaysiensis]|uniref:VWA domain-containing protein n=1 Tax=Microtetraspora malaysiensis TaxID=161358 RepID=UPI000833B35A|nr:VWA domain-containing protein [Microtetraspora malaysiensis]